jgi:hypothetical protein
MTKKRITNFGLMWLMSLILVALTITSVQAASNPMFITIQPTGCTMDGISQSRGELYYHQIYGATSVDGLTFNANNIPRLNHASKPDAVLNSKTTRLYFVNTEQTGIWIAEQKSNGMFEVINCVKLNGVFDSQATDPDIVRLADRRYRLFYVKNNTIFSAISEDGQDFTVEREIVSGSNPSAVQLSDGNWLMAYNNGVGVAFATSSDGRIFTTTDDVITSQGTPELMRLSNGKIRLLVGNQTMQSYISEDGGLSWSAEQPGASIINQTEEATGMFHPSVVSMSDNSWTIFYVVIGKADEIGPISGKIILQGRANHGGTNIYFSEESCSSTNSEPITTTGANGVFELNVNAGQNYQCLQVKHSGYLIGQRIAPVDNIGTITLLGGDVNGDNVINIFDLAQIAAGYDSNDPTLDINGDGIVDIFDLTITAINYNKRGPTE